MKMSEILNSLTKETIIKMFSSGCTDCCYCPLRNECRKASADGDNRGCEQFLNDMIEDDRNEG